MDLFTSFILGIIEGFSEFLPISSTAHLLLASKLLKLEETNFLKSFIVIIQFGAILAVVALYFKRISRDLEAIKRILVAFIPTAFIGFVLYKFIKGTLFENYNMILFVLGLGGLVLVIFELMHKDKNDTIEDISKIPYPKAFLIGCAQAVSVIPGVSRSAATIIGGMLLGVKRTAIVEFSFLLAIPTMFVATSYDLYRSAGSFTLDQFDLLAVGFVVSFIFAWISVSFFLDYVKKHSFILFGVYRIIAAIAFWFLIE